MWLPGRLGDLYFLIKIPAEAFFVDLGNRLIEIFQMTDSLAGRLAFQNAYKCQMHQG